MRVTDMLFTQKFCKMNIQITVSILLGFIAYWAVKIPATIQGRNPINTLADFLQANMKELFLSVIGVSFLFVAGDQIPATWGKIDGPVTAFLAGGSIPSMFMNFLGLINPQKK